MDDFLILKYLQDNKDMKGMHEEDLVGRFKNFMRKETMGRNYSRGGMRRYNHSDMDYPMEDYNDITMGEGFFERFKREVLRHNSSDMMDESYATYLVDNMYHTNKGMKYTGEKYSMDKAREILHKYKSHIPHNTKVEDIYVAINAQYHDYCALFKSWFGENIDSKIIESAIVFWFKDPDYTKGNKVYEYFKED